MGDFDELEGHDPQAEEQVTAEPDDGKKVDAKKDEQPPPKPAAPHPSHK
jgi:hypothetical protein